MAPRHARRSSHEANAPADVLNGGIRAKTPYRGEGGGSRGCRVRTPGFLDETGFFPITKKIASGFPASLRLSHRESVSPERVHRVLGVNTAGLRHKDPTRRSLTTLTEVVGCRLS